VLILFGVMKTMKEAECKKKAQEEGNAFQIDDIGRTLQERWKNECTAEQKQLYAERSEVLIEESGSYRTIKERAW